MEMRKFIVEIHPDGHVTCCEYEDSRDALKRAWLAGYRKALAHCNEQVSLLEAFEGTNLPASIRYQGAAQVRNAVEAHYHEYSNGGK